MKQKQLYLPIFLLTAALYLSGGLEPIEGELMDARFRLVQRPANDDLVLVAIDGKSLRELGIRPWPRDYHAAVLERLVSAGARVIAFDVAFDSSSDPEADARLEQALAATEKHIILPVYEHWRRAAGKAPKLVRTEPLPRFRQHATLATVNVRPEADGLVRRMPMRRAWKDTAVPGLAAELADQQYPLRNTYYVDYGIDVASVARLSFVDVLAGNFDPGMLAGKAVMVGATAIGLGDQVPVPLYETLPGTLLRALAYQSLVQGRALYRVGAVPILVGVLVLAWFLGPRFSDWSWRRGLGAMALCIAGLALLALAAHAFAPVILDTSPWALTLLLSYGACLVSRIDRQAMHLFVQRASFRRRHAVLRAVVEQPRWNPAHR